MAIFVYSQQNTIYNTQCGKKRKKQKCMLPWYYSTFWCAHMYSCTKASHLPSHSEMIPTQKEDSMPPIEKMATERDQREVSVDSGMGFEYRCIHVELYSVSIIWGETEEGVDQHYIRYTGEKTWVTFVGGNVMAELLFNKQDEPGILLVVLQNYRNVYCQYSVPYLHSGVFI